MEKELYLAAEAGNVVDVLRILASKINININWRNNDEYRTPLWIASCNGYLEVVELLVGKDADIELLDKVILYTIVVTNHYKSRL